MRYLIICLFLTVGSVFAQTPKKISSYPAAPSFDPEDLFFVSDGGKTSRKMTGLLMQNWVQAADDGVRIALGDTAAVLRTMIGGGGLFQKSLSRIRPVNINDSLGIGISPTLGRLHVNGNSYFNGTISTTALTLISGGLVYMNGDEMMFYSNNTGLVSLTSLMGGGSEFTKTGTTNYTTTPTDNWHFGGTTATTYKMKVTGSGYFTDDVNIENYLRLTYGSATTLDTYIEALGSPGAIRIGSNQEVYASRMRLSLYAGMSSADNGMAGLGTSDNDQYIWFVPNGTEPAYLKFQNGASDAGYLYDGTYWRDATDTLSTMAYTRANGGSGGGGIVDTTGLPAANQVTYFTSATKIGSNDNFTFDGDSVGLGYLDPVHSGTRFIVLTSNAKLDSGVLNPVFRGLQDPLWDIHKHLADKKTNEISWYHIDNVTGELIKTYGLTNDMDAFEELQYTAEMSLRLIADQERRIAELEKKQNINKWVIIPVVLLFFAFILYKRKLDNVIEVEQKRAR